MNKVALLLPDEESISQGREYQTSKDPTGIVMGCQEIDAMCQQEDP